MSDRAAMHPCQVFVSYSHKDRGLVEELTGHLEKIRVQAVWDKNIQAGDRFTESIKYGIAHSHAYMPVITPNTSDCIHQEIGYATALNVPVVPICIGEVPVGMIQELQAVAFDKVLHDLEEKLHQTFFDDLVL